MKPFPDKRDGDPIEPRDLNRAYEALRALRKMRGAGGVVVNSAASLTDPPTVQGFGPTRTEARLTGPYSGGYPWAQVLIGANGSLTLTGVAGGPASGDPAYERRTGDTSLTAGDAVYQLTRSPASGEWVFPHRVTTPTPTPTPTHTVIGCPCPAIPDTFYLRVASPELSDFGKYYIQPATMRWQTTPADCTGGAGFTGYWSDNVMQYAAFGATQPQKWRYFFTCVRGAYRLRICSTDDSIPTPGPGFGELWSWIIFGATNTCTPWKLTNGTDEGYAGDSDHGRIQAWTTP